MPNFWDMTDEEITKLSDKEIGQPIPEGYIWNPEKVREARIRETKMDALRNREQGIRKRPPSRIHDAATGRVTEDPGGMERVHGLQAKGGLAQMLAEQGGDEEIVNAAREIESMPGGPELLYTHAAEEMMGAMGIPKKDAKKVRLYEITDEAVRKAKGGAISAAEKTRKAGRGSDSMILHMSPEEVEVISAMWGPPEVNPKTGMGEYGFLSKIWKKVKKGVKKVVKSKIFQIVAPIALSIFVPGLGTAIGMALTGGAMGAGAAAVVGNAVVQGGLGALSGGKEGALKGAIAGGLGGAAGAYGSKVGASVGLSGKTADVVGSAMIQGAGSELTGGDFTEGAISGGLSAATRGSQENISKDFREGLGMKPAEETALGQYNARKEAEMLGITGPSELDVDAAGDPYSPTTDRPVTDEEILAGVEPGRTDRTTSPLPAGTDPLAAPGATAPPPMSLMDLAGKYAIPGALALGAATQGEYEEGPPPEWQQQDGNFNESLPQFSMNRQFQGLSSPQDYYTYGQKGAPTAGDRMFVDTRDPFPGDTSPLAAAAGATGAQPVQLPPGRAGMAQRRSLEQQGWTFNVATNTMNPPSQAAGQATPAAPAGPGGSGGTSFVGGGQARGGYQQGGEFNYWEQNQDVPNAAPTVSREGGHHVRGPGSGRSDDIPAYLSDGEYVIDAESVALLGDGSGSAGAQRLDEMRKELRQHKASKMKKGEFTHKAKKPVGYMSKVKKLRRNVQYEHGGLHNVAAGGSV